MINFVNSLWVLCHVIVRFFEAIHTSRVVVVAHVKDLLSSYNILEKLIVHVKDEGGNLSTFTQVFTLIVNCGPSRLAIPW